MVPGLGRIAEIGEIAQAFSGMLTELRASTERLQDLVFKLGTLNDMVEMAAKIPKVEDLLAHVLERTMRAVSASIGSIMLFDRERQVLRVAVGRGMDMEHARSQVEVKVGEGIAGKVVELGEAVLVEDVEKDPRFAKINDPKYGGGSFICVPLRVGDRIVGVVNLAKKEQTPGAGSSQPFTPTDLQFLNALMTYTAYAVDNARLFQEAREAAQKLQEVVEDQKLRLTLAQQQMLEAAKLSALGELVAGVAHELNSPLTVLVGTTDMLEESAPPELQPHVSLMKEALVSARSVVRGLLTFGRRTPLEKTHVSPTELVDKVLALTAGELRVAAIKVEKEFDPELPTVWADANQLQQVLVNLITNAKHAMEDVRGRAPPRHLAAAQRIRSHSLAGGGLGPGHPGRPPLQGVRPLRDHQERGDRARPQHLLRHHQRARGTDQGGKPRGSGRRVHDRSPDRDLPARAGQQPHLTPAILQAGADTAPRCPREDDHALPPVRPDWAAGVRGGLWLLADGRRSLRRDRGRRGGQGHPPRARSRRELRGHRPGLRRGPLGGSGGARPRDAPPRRHPGHQVRREGPAPRPARPAARFQPRQHPA